MRVLRFAAALSLSAGVALSAGSALAQGNDRLDGYFLIRDTRCDDPDEPDNIANYAYVILGGDSDNNFRVNTYVEGIGTGTDLVRITLVSDLPNSASANDKKGSVSQKSWAELCFYIDDPSVEDGGRDTLVNGETALLCTSIEKCSVKGTYGQQGTGDSNSSNDTFTGNARGSCSADGLYDVLDPDQIDSVRTAFPTTNKCRVKINVQRAGKKSSFSMKLNNKREPIPDEM